MHHIVSRRVLAVRHERQNHLALCRDCHRWWHDSPKRARAWLESRWPGRLEALKAAATPIRVGSERAEALESAKRLRATAGEER